MEPRSVDDLLAEARARLERVPADNLDAEMASGALIVDTRPFEQRKRDGELPGAMVIDRNVLEWRLDPTSPVRIPSVVDHDARIIVVCNEGYSSSLVAATLQDLGLHRATDLIGGYQAWAARDQRREPRHSAERARQWADVYSNKDETEVSWFQPEPSLSLTLLDELGVEPTASLIDVGGGASLLVDALLDHGFDDVTILDVAARALHASQERLGRRADLVQWVTADVLNWQSERRYDIWHDRAVFHFLVAPAEQARYVDALTSTVNEGGHIVMATFALDGPEQCSGLPTVRYDAPHLAGIFSADFDLIQSRREQHRTPSGVVQPFTWVALRRR